MASNARFWPPAFSMGLILIGFVVFARVLAGQENADTQRSKAQTIDEIDRLIEHRDFARAEQLLNEPRWAGDWDAALRNAQLAQMNARPSDSLDALLELHHSWIVNYHEPSPDTISRFQDIAFRLHADFQTAGARDLAHRSYSLALIVDPAPLRGAALGALLPADDPDHVPYLVLDDFETVELLPVKWRDESDAPALVMRTTDVVYRGASSAAIDFGASPTGDPRWYAVRVAIPLEGYTYALRAHVKAANLNGDELIAGIWLPNARQSLDVRSTELIDAGDGWQELVIARTEIDRKLRQARADGIDTGGATVIRLGIRGDNLAGKVFVDAFDLIASRDPEQAPSPQAEQTATIHNDSQIHTI